MAPSVRASTGSGRSSCSQNSARFRSVPTISGGMVGAPNALSSARTSASRPFWLEADQHDAKEAQKRSRAVRGRVDASSRHARSAGLGDCRSISTETCRIHSSQSSFVDRDDESHARLSANSSTVNDSGPPATSRGLRENGENAFGSSSGERPP